MPQMTGDDLPEGDVIEKVSKILHIDIVFNKIISSVRVKYILNVCICNFVTPTYGTISNGVSSC